MLCAKWHQKQSTILHKQESSFNNSPSQINTLWSCHPTSLLLPNNEAIYEWPIYSLFVSLSICVCMWTRDTWPKSTPEREDRQWNEPRPHNVLLQSALLLSRCTSVPSMVVSAVERLLFVQRWSQMISNKVKINKKQLINQATAREGFKHHIVLVARFISSCSRSCIHINYSKIDVWQSKRKQQSWIDFFGFVQCYM